jgi:hypothetical protein
MKDRLAITTCFVVLLCWTGSAFAQTNRLDITLQGPWILYVDKTFAGKISVLVAFAPGTHGRFAHKPPFFSTGNGLPIDRAGTYCVGFDTTCALDRHVTDISTDGYPTTAPTPLYVKPPSQDWEWVTHRQRDATYLIFPMPDSYSNDGTYKMTFSDTFKKYDYTKEQEHSIGVQLHYDKGTGPSTLDLYDCGNHPATIKDCTIAGGARLEGSLPNSGTLDVEMKAPSGIDACDPHVRSAYPQMLHLLDPDPNTLATAKDNKNLDKAFIDIPTNPGSGAGKSTYDPDCYLCDEQGSDLSKCPPMTATPKPMLEMGKDVMYGPTLDVRSELDNIVTVLRRHPDLDQQKLEVPELSKVEDALNGGLLPTFSELEWLKLLLSRSTAELLTAVNVKVSQTTPTSVPATRDANAESRFSDLAGALFREQQLTLYVTNLAAAKDGKDCRAPVMLLKYQ